MSGFFVTLEGPEGAGKSTHAAMLSRRLRDLGWEVVAVREPGGTPVGESIRGLLQREEHLEPEAELLLFAACRAQLVRSVILPALERGACVVCDRFADSTVAYQGFGRGLPLEVIERLNAFAVGGRWPDLTLLLDLEPELGLRRIAERYGREALSHDRIEKEAAAFHERVRRGFLRLAAQAPERWRVIDCSGDVAPVGEAVWSAVAARVQSRPRPGSAA